MSPVADAVPRVGRTTVVIAPDRSGHWTDNPELLHRLAEALTGCARGRVGVEAVDRTLLRVTRPGGGSRHLRVSASHEAGRVGVALTTGPGIGFDLCGNGRAASIRSALPLVLSTAERALLPPADAPTTGPQSTSPAEVVLWTAIEALTKLAGGRLLSPASRPRLTSVAPPLAAGTSLAHGCCGDLTWCAALSPA
ncbi:hypothetical protein [Raineyella fluvialis]|uniref:Uncharacterized protein n=1 Tax=Raineyella fluvialis TaxID=2662261 RepID=A0A5Q2FCR9_9ACTN|nr:hypothetical protein [Raineyella fluvialis]QGF24181.1 hypothetical protein Rai3103_11435 [Raineyella fluvialis]